jgi:hypothetical protein
MDVGSGKAVVGDEEDEEERWKKWKWNRTTCT